MIGIGMDKPMQGAKPLEFKPPKGADIPEVAEGEEFEMPAKFSKKPNGTICLVEVAGGRMPGYETPNDTQEEEEEGEGPGMADEREALRGKAEAADEAANARYSSM